MNIFDRSRKWSFLSTRECKTTGFRWSSTLGYIPFGLSIFPKYCKPEGSRVIEMETLEALEAGPLTGQ